LGFCARHQEAGEPRRSMTGTGAAPSSSLKDWF